MVLSLAYTCHSISFERKVWLLLRDRLLKRMTCASKIIASPRKERSRHVVDDKKVEANLSVRI